MMCLIYLLPGSNQPHASFNSPIRFTSLFAWYISIATLLTNPFFCFIFYLIEVAFMQKVHIPNVQSSTIILITWGLSLPFMTKNITVFRFLPIWSWLKQNKAWSSCLKLWLEMASVFPASFTLFSHKGKKSSGRFIQHSVTKSILTVGNVLVDLFSVTKINLCTFLCISHTSSWALFFCGKCYLD